MANTDDHLGDDDCVGNVIALVCTHLGERPVMDAVLLLMTAAACIMGKMEKSSPGIYAVIMPGLVAATTKAVRHVAARPDSPTPFDGSSVH